MMARIPFGGMASSTLVILLLVPVPREVAAQTVEVLHSFSGCVPSGCADGDGGEHPASTLVEGPDGALYGTTAGGSFGGSSKGTIFRIAPGGAMTTLFSFRVTEPPGSLICPNGCFPVGTLTYGADGAFYGATLSGGLYGDGTLFRITLNGSFTKLHDFDIDGNPANNGGGPVGGLVQGVDGHLYGTTQSGGTSQVGTVFRLENDGSITTLFSFSGPDGLWPTGDLVRGNDGTIYGITQSGGTGGSGNPCGGPTNGCGTVFRVSASGSVSIVHAFDGTAGWSPASTPVHGVDGNLYGTNASGGTGCGTAYRLTPDGTATLLHAFGIGRGGCLPLGTLVQGMNGDLYGTTADPVGGHQGSVYQLTPAGAATSIHDFLGPEGSRPFGGLVETSDGYLYGTTYDGGAFNLGVVFRILLPARNSTLSVTEDTPEDGTLIANYPTGTLTFSIVSNGELGTATITNTATGAFTYVPNADANGSDHFTFKANNGVVDSNVATVTVTIIPVNDAPVAKNGAISATQGAATTGTLLASDIESDSLTFTIVTNGNQGTASIINASTGEFTYTPAGDALGPDSFTFKANDGTSDSNNATISVNVTANNSPVAHDQSVNATEDAQNPIVLTASDVDGEFLTFAVVGSPIHGTLSGSAPDMTYSPSPNYSGPDSFTFKASDGLQDSNTATVSITVTPVNDTPVADHQDVTMTEDTGHPIVLTATDADGDAVTLAIVSGPTHGTLDGSAPNLIYVPSPNYHGVDSFTFKANDGSVDSNAAIVSIAIAPVNDPPIAVDDSFSGNEDTAFTVVAPGLLSNDTDVDGDNVSALEVTAPAHGTLALNPSGSFIYTPAANYSGKDVFTYRVNDGTASSDVATVLLTVNPVNDAPVASNSTLTANEGSAANGSLAATDIDGPALTFTIVSNGTKGTATITNGVLGTFTYTPAANAIGPDAFTFKASDGSRDSNVATVSVTIVPVNNRAPVAVNDAYSTNINSVLVVPARGVLANDVDSNGDPLTALLVAQPPHGSVALRNDGSFTYTPAPNFIGQDSFRYRATDGTARSNVATVAVAVTAPIVRLTPDSVQFGNQAVGNASEARVITIRNVGNAPLTFAGTTIIGTNAAEFARSTNCGASLAPGLNCQIGVTFTPTGTGPRSATIQIRTDALGSPHAIRLMGIGIIRYTGVVNFRPVVVGRTTQRGVSIRNTAPNVPGSPRLQIASIAIVGSDIGDFAIWEPPLGDPFTGTICRPGNSVAPQSACEIFVQFRPLTFGPRTADLIITFFDGVSTQAFRMMGVGIRETP
ncbi:MAG: tandem-95 repeat protein [Acidobacteria bacterium]|nr:MAG: tandem-95 repeat protein [Acidobacteriota bacterium]